MSHRGLRGRIAPRLLCAVALMLTPLLANCGGDAAKYAGTWKRDLSGEGEVHMRLTSGGRMELMLPSPRWPDSVDVKQQVAFKGDTITFKADTAANHCQTADARYILSRDGDELRISGIGMDTCGGRRAGLVGRWAKA